MAQYRPLRSWQNLQGKPQVPLHLRKGVCSRGRPERSTSLSRTGWGGAELQGYQQQRPPSLPGCRSFINLSMKREGNFCHRSTKNWALVSRRLSFHFHCGVVTVTLPLLAQSTVSRLLYPATQSLNARTPASRIACHSTDAYQVLLRVCRADQLMGDRDPGQEG